MLIGSETYVCMYGSLFILWKCSADVWKMVLVVDGVWQFGDGMQCCGSWVMRNGWFVVEDSEVQDDCMCCWKVVCGGG